RARAAPGGVVSVRRAGGGGGAAGGGRGAPPCPEAGSGLGRSPESPPIPALPDHLRGRSFVVVEAASLLGQDATDELLRPLRALDPQIDTFATMPVQELKHLHMDPEQPVPGAGDGMVLADLSDAAIDALVQTAGVGSHSP